MARAFIFLATGFEEVEMLTVVDMLRRAGIDIKMVAIGDSLWVTSSHHVTVMADRLMEDVDFDEAEMLIIPGGMPGTMNLRACKPLCEQLKKFAEEGKKLAAVCAGPTVLGQNGILKGKKATCFPSFEEELLGCEFVKQPVVVDGNIITSRGMGTCIEFAGAIIEMLEDKATADQVKEKIIYNDTY